MQNQNFINVLSFRYSVSGISIARLVNSGDSFFYFSLQHYNILFQKCSFPAKINLKSKSYSIYEGKNFIFSLQSYQYIQNKSMIFVEEVEKKFFAPKGICQEENSEKIV